MPLLRPTMASALMLLPRAEERRSASEKMVLTRTIVATAVAAASVGIVVTLVGRAGRKAHRTPSSGCGVVITGASSGIGRHAAETLAEKGYTVFAGVRSDKDAQEVGAAHANILPLKLEVTDVESIAAAAEHVKQTLKERGLPLAGVVNNAGISYVMPVELMDLQALRNVLEVNLVGVVAVTQAFTPQLRASGGRVVNVGSVLGFSAIPLYGAYSASKFGLNAITDAMRMELSDWNVSVSLVEPGTIKTRIQDKMSGTQAAYRKLPAEQYGLYRRWFDGIEEALKMHEKQAGSLTLTSDAITHAITSPYPQTRYTVGGIHGVPFSVSKLLLGFMPDRVQDGMKMP